MVNTDYFHAFASDYAWKYIVSLSELKLGTLQKKKLTEQIESKINYLFWVFT